LKFPNREDIVNLNIRHVRETGGNWNAPENMVNPGSLEWVLEAIRYPLFGVDLYPSIGHKAAILAWTIIDGHVFLDGCKRTGISSMEIFLITNGYRLDALGNEIRDTALKIAKRKEEPYSIVEFTDWVTSKAKPNRIIYIAPTSSQVL